ncbi:natural killer cells antigen CD94 [Anabrus simplex]|uniref:natural killer cells antigen CD94 n=1 Tax=Anabrus simplex TaxID=316456 RepID=UPI0035A32C1E
MWPVTPSTTAPATDNTIEPTVKPTTTILKSCPQSGYQLFVDFNCYKGYDELLRWSNAREQCRSDGGDLMVAESERERKEVYSTMYQSVSSTGYLPWMGVYFLEHGKSWVSVKGEPARSIWWGRGQPYNRADRKCAAARSSGQLGSVSCEELRPFICEIAL